MITDNEKFIEIQAILASSNINTRDCAKINDLIIELSKENQELKKVIDKITNLIKQYGKYDGKKCTCGFQMWSADFNKILDMLKEVE